MARSTSLVRVAVATSLAASLASSPLAAAGFSIFEQGAKAMGMAGAFTAQADDPSAMYHNIGGLAFLDGLQVAVGTTLIGQTTSDFFGADPFPGRGADGERTDTIFFPSHVYATYELAPRWRAGLAVNSPFGLATEWKNPDTWPGRAISYDAEMRTFDLTAGVGWQVAPTFGVGAGVTARWSDLELNRRLLLPHPISGLPVDVADATLDSDLDSGVGYTVGLLHKPSPRIQWGLSYRSKITVDYGGDLRLDQIPTGLAPFDQLVASVLPFGEDIPVSTSIEFPDLASLGVGFAVGARSWVEVDFDWTGWSSFDRLKVDVPSEPQFAIDRQERWENVWSYRFGYRWRGAGRTEWRLGYAYDESPQPVRSVSPLLAGRRPQRVHRRLGMERNRLPGRRGAHVPGLRHGRRHPGHRPDRRLLRHLRDHGVAAGHDLDLAVSRGETIADPGDPAGNDRAAGSPFSPPREAARRAHRW